MKNFVRCVDLKASARNLPVHLADTAPKISPEAMQQKKKSDENLISFGALDEFGADLGCLIWFRLEGLLFMP